MLRRSLDRISRDSIESAIAVLCVDDGSLPDIKIDFCGHPAVPQAYAFIRSCAAGLVSKNNSYWLKSGEKACVFGFEDDPTGALLQGDAEAFHVVFGGLRSPGGHAVPDLGVFCFDPSSMALDYKMGPGWDASAVIGLFEILLGASAWSERVVITHEGNIFDEYDALMGAYRHWLKEVK